jgi:gluconokinase
VFEATLTLSANAIVIMGISGCGKTTLGKGLAEATGYRFIEGDDLHPAENIAKMSAGIALTDDDRWPWLERVAEVLNTARADDGCIVSCSALRYAYRHLLRARSGERLLFVFPNVSTEIVRARLRNRPDHYMPPSLLDSQVATLELPRPDEAVLTIDGTATPDQSVTLVMGFLSMREIHTQHIESTPERRLFGWHAKP